MSDEIEVSVPASLVARHATWLSQPHAWAVPAQTMAIITAVGRRELSVDAARERNEMRAALRSEAPTPPQSAVAVLTLRGMVTARGTIIDELCGGGGGLEAFGANLSEAVASADVASILIDIDSPGGLVDLVPETAALIRDASAVKPVVAIANTLAASAAYWLASQADEVVITPSGYIGSIGVYMAHEDWSGHQAMDGIKTTLVSAGRFKVEGNPFEPLSDEARAAMQFEVDDLYDLFVADVAAGRGASEQAVREGYGQGRVMNARRAVPAGLADRIATVDDVIAEMMQAAGGGGALRAGAGRKTIAASAQHLSAPPPGPEPDDHEPADDEIDPGADQEPEVVEDQAATAAAAREARERFLAVRLQ